MKNHTKRAKQLNICGPEVRRIRYKLNLSQQQLAAKCQLQGWDVSRDIIARIELQIRWIGDFELIQLAKSLGVTLKELFPSKAWEEMERKKRRAGAKA